MTKWPPRICRQQGSVLSHQDRCVAYFAMRHYHPQQEQADSRHRFDALQTTERCLFSVNRDVLDCMGLRFPIQFWLVERLQHGAWRIRLHAGVLWISAAPAMPSVRMVKRFAFPRRNMFPVRLFPSCTTRVLLVCPGEQYTHHCACVVCLR